MANMVYGEAAKDCGIKKVLLHPGTGQLPKYEEGAKVKFHYQTRLCNDDHTVLDDSKADASKTPMELIIGKKFKLEVWEACLKTMVRGETASFTVDKHLCVTYPLVAKSLRGIRSGKPLKEQAHHCCGLTLKEEGLGYEDLDKLMKEPQELEFILESVEVEESGDYKKEAWVMSEEEKREAVPQLQEEGNNLYRQRDISAAADKYAQAIGILEQLLLREKPNDDPWLELDKLKIPLLLNYSQCKLSLGDYYPVIEHTSEVLKKDPNNIKALFRRAKAHVGAWNPQEAKEDFLMAAQLDPSLQKAIQKELKFLDEKQHMQDLEDKAKLQGKMFG